jgi:prepilin peptidase CpaA
MTLFNGVHIGANVLCAVAVGSAACVTDLRSRRIPNVLTLGSAGVALLFHSVAPSGMGFLSALSGWLVGAAVMFVPFALRGLGGGDVKLLAAIGAWTGPVFAFWVGMYTGMAGAVLAIVVAGYCGYIGRAFKNVWFLLQHWCVVGLRPLDDISLEGSTGPRLIYAFPILAGLLLATWLR